MSGLEQLSLLAEISATYSGDSSHAGWHIPGWALGGLSSLCFFTAAAGSANAEGLYVAGTSLGLATGVWCFVAIVFRKFF